MAAVDTPRLLTLAEYVQLADLPGYRDELIEGARILAPYPELEHADIVEQLAAILNRQLSQLSCSPLRVYRETAWRIHDPEANLDSLPGPDLMVVREEDWRSSRHSGRWFSRTPLFVVEVISPSERRGRRFKKVAVYLNAGTPFVVKVIPELRRVLVHSSNAESITYSSSEVLENPFRASVDEIFSVLDV